MKKYFPLCFLLAFLGGFHATYSIAKWVEDYYENRCHAQEELERKARNWDKFERVLGDVAPLKNKKIELCELNNSEFYYGGTAYSSNLHGDKVSYSFYLPYAIITGEK